MNNNIIRIFLCFPSSGTWFACDVPDSLSFREILAEIGGHLPSECRQYRSMDSECFVFEYTQNIPCDTGISLAALGALSGMSFAVY